jgi:hypothetical protein
MIVGGANTAEWDFDEEARQVSGEILMHMNYPVSHIISPRESVVKARTNCRRTKTSPVE